jgi:hypothetical protein
MQKLVIVDDAIILSLLNDVAFVEQIPCLYNKREIFRAGGTGCGSCAKKRQDRQRTEMSNIKSCLVGLSPDKKNLLKKKLNAEQVRVVFAGAGGQPSQFTF